MHKNYENIDTNNNEQISDKKLDLINFPKLCDVPGVAQLCNVLSRILE